MTLTPHPLLVPWSRKGRAIPLLPLWAVQPVQSLSACTMVHLTFTFIIKLQCYVFKKSQRYHIINPATQISYLFTVGANFLENINKCYDTPSLKRISKSQLDCLDLYEQKQHKQWFDEECLHFLNQRKHAKIQWLQDPNQSNVDNLINLT